MIWKSHYLVTGVAVFALTENILATAAAVHGSVLPDAIEFLFPRKMIKHRGITHWWPVYLVPILIILSGFRAWGIDPLISLNEAWNMYISFQVLDFIRVILMNVLLWILVGACFHIVEDTLTGYIPFLTPYDRRKIHIFFYPGAPKEYAFDLVFCTLVGAIKYAQIHGYF